MKKVLLACLALVLVLSLSTSTLKAAEKPFDLGLNFGVMTDDSFKFSPFQWTVGAELDLKIGDYLMVCPEVSFWSVDFDFATFSLVPGAILNAKLSSLFVGAGVIYPILLKPSGGTSELTFKVNAGFVGGGLKLTAFMITPFDNMFASGFITFGATLGFMF